MSTLHSTEVWKSITGFVGSYEVSNRGAIRSLDRLITRNSKTARINGRVLSPTIGKTGYLSVMLGSKSGRFYVHRLVAEEFLDRVNGADEVNHKNGIKSDNNAENLEWSTRSQNVKHSFEVLKRHPTWLGKFGSRNPTSKSVVAKNIVSGKSFRFASCSEAGRNGFSTSEVARCCRGEVMSHKGFVFAWGSAHDVVWQEAEQWMVDADTGEILEAA